MIFKVRQGGWKSFEECLADLQNIIIAEGSASNIFYDEFLELCANTFGKKKVRNYLEAQADQPEISALINDMDEHKRTRQEYQKKAAAESCSPTDYIEAVKRLGNDDHLYISTAGISRRFWRQR